MNLTPGFYPDMTEAIYHADPAPMPSLSSSCAKTLVSRSPLHAWNEHPRLGATPRADSDEMDFGALAHKLLLGKGAEIAVCPSDTWRGRDAAAFWDAAKKSGQIPCLQKTLDRAVKMADAAKHQLSDMGLGFALADSPRYQSEVAGFWKEGPAWCRLLIDRLIVDDDAAHILDIKTMSQSAHPRACAARIASMGYDIQRAHYMRGLEVLKPNLAGRIEFTFIFIETVAPFAVTPVTLDGEWSAVGQAKWERALQLWQDCLASNNWHGYVTAPKRLEAPHWALMEEMNLEQQ